MTREELELTLAWARQNGGDIATVVLKLHAENERLREENENRRDADRRFAEPCDCGNGEHPVGRHNWEVLKREHELLTRERAALKAEVERLEDNVEIWTDRAAINGKRAFALEDERDALRLLLSPFVPEIIRRMSAHDVVASKWSVTVTGTEMLRLRDALNP